MAKKILTAYYTTDCVPTVGLTPTIDIFLLDPLNPLVSTLVVSAGATTEIGNGWYRYDFLTYDPTQNYVFTFDGGSSLSACDRYKTGGNESYSEDTTQLVMDESLASHTVPGSLADTITSIKSDTATLVINDVTLAALLNLVVQFQRNRTSIDTVNATMTLYADDCTTPIWVWNLLDLNGMPSVQEVCTRMPQICPEPPAV